ncbi:flagellar basal-body M-ring protein/flagellar hook-basal body protein FliF [Methylophilaceae bacterium 11]|nr:flagellar basal-body M-ring protein/flagellar hook-basal body protein FliF [Methylophilaceae bacterium 11]
MSGMSKAVFVILLMTVIGLFVFSVVWVTKDDYQVLFSDLNPLDASSMVSELEHLKVPYKLTEGGTTILVESDAVYKTRLKLIGKGLNLNGSVGFELFNNAEFGMTEFAQKVNYLRALQGELERTIVSFDEIKSARVHLVLPESGLFKRKDAKPKASVTVMMKNGMALSSEQVLGIQKLVSASVPEVTPSEVTIVDQRGVALTKNTLSGSEASNLYERLDVKKQLETYITSKIVDVLDRVVGTGKAIVSVDINLSYDQVKITKEDIVPLPNTYGQSIGAITRKRTTSQRDEAATQADTFEDGQIVNQNSPASSSMSEIEFINNKKIEQILSMPGAINKLSVGVFVPNINDPVKLEKIKEVISMTAGINVRRGDGLVVHDIEVPQLAMQAETTLNDTKDKGLADIHNNQATTKRMSSPQYYWILGAAILFLLLLIASVIKQQRKKALTVTNREKLLDEINLWAKS